MVPEVGSAPTSPPLQGGANLPQLLGEMIPSRGNAPRSLAYRASALLLSYKGLCKATAQPSRARHDPVVKSVQQGGALSGCRLGNSGGQNLLDYGSRSFSVGIVRIEAKALVWCIRR